MQLQIGNKAWTVTLENNTAAHAFSQRLPFSAEMTELNGNEKYVYLDRSLPSNPQKIGTIRTGDLMLFGDNCLVLFYRDFSSSYRYTRLGRVSDPSGLARHVGSGPISVSFLSE